MRLLFLNWRCPTHPKAGGAELLTLRIAERLVLQGHSVTWFAATYKGSPSEEFIHGIRIVRRGGQVSVHVQARRWYLQHGRGQFDLVIDEINTVPFFAHIYTEVPTIAMINQLAREVWWYEIAPPFAAVGYIAERLYLQAYRTKQVITISESSAQSLREYALSGLISIIPMATDFLPEPEPSPVEDKEGLPTLICLGRVVSSKRVDHAIRALRYLDELGLRAQLWVVGMASPKYCARLQRLAMRHGVAERVVFWGWVNDHQKRWLLRRAHILVACSVREGWGLMVTEANAVGTPAVVYNVPGLRDSTQAGITGMICESNSPADLATRIAQLLRDRDDYERLRRNAWRASLSLDWDKTTRAFLKALKLEKD